MPKFKVTVQDSVVYTFTKTFEAADADAAQALAESEAWDVASGWSEKPLTGRVINSYIKKIERQ